MPALKDFIFKALGGVPPPVYNFGFKDTTGVHQDTPPYFEGLLPENQMRDIWLGNKDNPPTGTHYNPNIPRTLKKVNRKPQWTGNKFGEVPGAPFPSRWEDAIAKAQEEYPYAMQNLDTVTFDPLGTSAKSASAYVSKRKPREIVLGRPGDSLDPYKTLLHELTHVQQFGAFPNAEDALAKSNNSVLETPAYRVSGEDEHYKKLLERLTGKKYDDWMKPYRKWNR